MSAPFSQQQPSYSQSPAGPPPVRPAPPPPAQPQAAGPAPFRQAAAAYQPALTLEQFASLRAELVVSPAAQHGEVRARYKLDDATFFREEAAWQEKLTRDKDLLKRYMQHFQYMRGLLAPR
jgi:hypothetical protein